MEAKFTKREKELLLDLLAVLKEDVQLDYEDTVMIAIQVNTQKKMEALKDWLRTKMDGDMFHLTAVELLNKTAEIGRM